MKNIKRKLTALALSAITAISFVGCSAFENIKKDLDDYFDAPCTHIDENTDNVCDSCGATITTNDTTDTPATDTETHVCTSENESFYCSDCGNVMPAVVLDYYANDAELMAYSLPSDISCAELIGNVFLFDNALNGILLTFQAPDGYECSVTLLNDGTLKKDGATFFDGIYTSVLDVDLNTGNSFYDMFGNKINLGDSVFYYIPTDFTVQFYDSTENVYVTYKFSECNVFFLAGNKVIDVSIKDEKALINSIANDEIPYKTYAMDENNSPLLSGMSCLSMLGHVYKFPTVDGSIIFLGTFFTLKTADGVEIKLKYSLEKMWFYTDYGDVIDDSLLMNIASGSNSVYVLLSGDMVIPISETETVYLSECTLVSTPALICIPDVAIDSNNK